MIPVKKALESLSEVWFTLGTEVVPLHESVGRVLAKPVRAPFDIPPFSSAAMDGVAVAFPFKERDLQPGSVVKVVGEVRAGSVWKGRLTGGEGVWIFTGASIPEGTDAVVMREHLRRDGDTVRILRRVRKGDNVRLKGEEAREGEEVIPKDTVLSPVGIGGLAALGITSVEVYRLPKVALITTGDEVVDPPRKLEEGQVYNVHAYSLPSAMRGLTDQLHKWHVRDDLKEVERALEEALEKSDVVIFTGGVSAGDYDFVRHVLDKRFDRLFYKVAQKPGKPLYVGFRERKIVFGLPGNPSSALVCFYVYVYPTLRALAGHRNPYMYRAKRQLEHGFKKKSGRTWFVWAKEGRRGFRILRELRSHWLASYSQARFLVELPARRVQFKGGEYVWAYILPM